MSRRREKHTALIDALERELFPFQESEEEQESFTPEGRRRVDRFIDQRLRTPLAVALERDPGCISHAVDLLRWWVEQLQHTSHDRCIVEHLKQSRECARALAKLLRADGRRGI